MLSRMYAINITTKNVLNSSAACPCSVVLSVLLPGKLLIPVHILVTREKGV